MGLFSKSNSMVEFKKLAPADQARFCLVHSFGGYLLFMLDSELKQDLPALVQNRIGWSRIMELLLPHLLVPMQIPNAASDPLLFTVPNRQLCGDQFKGNVEIICHQQLSGQNGMHSPTRVLTDPEISKDPFASFQQFTAVLLNEARIENTGSPASPQDPVFVKFHKLVDLSYKVFRQKYDENASRANDRVLRDLEKQNKGIEGFLTGFRVFCMMRDNPKMLSDVLQEMKKG